MVSQIETVAAGGRFSLNLLCHAACADASIHKSLTTVPTLLQSLPPAAATFFLVDVSLQPVRTTPLVLTLHLNSECLAGGGD